MRNLSGWRRMLEGCHEFQREIPLLFKQLSFCRGDIYPVRNHVIPNIAKLIFLTGFMTPVPHFHGDRIYAGLMNQTPTRARLEKP